MDDDDDSTLFPPHRSNQYDLNSKIMLTAVVSLSVVIVIVTILHLYARCFLRRHARRRTAMLQLRLAVSQAHAGEPPKTGLDPSVIASLPIFVFKKTDCRDRDGETSPPAPAVECAVCLSFLEEEEMARLLPNCNHTFHAECIDKWLASQPTCPICRAEAEPHPRPGLCESAAGPPPTAPPLERVSSALTSAEGTSDGGAVQSSAKIGGGSSSRLSSFRRILSMERSSRRIQSCGGEDGQGDIERQ